MSSRLRLTALARSIAVSELSATAAASWAIAAVTALCCETASEIASESSLILPIVSAIDSAWALQASALAVSSAICPAMSLVALAVCVASDFTSEATTAKPRPVSPARAAARWSR